MKSENKMFFKRSKKFNIDSMSLISSEARNLLKNIQGKIVQKIRRVNLVQLSKKDNDKLLKQIVIKKII